MVQPIKIFVIEDSPGVRDYLTELVQIVGYHAQALEEKTKFYSQMIVLNALSRCSTGGKVRNQRRVVFAQAILALMSRTCLISTELHQARLRQRQC